jgi:Alginate export
MKAPKVAILGAGLLAGLSAAAETAPPTLERALLGGKPVLGLRARIEDVSEDAFALDATASTVRLRLTYESLPWKRWSVGTEVDYLAVLGGDSFNSTRNGRTTRPQIPDPEGLDLNQAFIKYSGTKEDLIIGRQRLAFDNQRFIGAVGWRQNEQTSDAFTVRSKRVPRLALAYSYADNVNRVFGPDAGTPPPDLRLRMHALNAAGELGKAGKLSGFHYTIDVRNSAALSQATSGLLWTGKAPIGKSGWSLPWSLSYAVQSDAGANPTDYSAHYTQVELGVMHDRGGLRLGHEVLSGDATRAERRFQTPLATLHIYQGWADKFLATPPQGVEDFYVAAQFKRKSLDLQLAWHDFRAEAVNRSYGSELDVSVGYKLAGKTDLLAKLASYDADGLGTDTTKFWLQVAREFK